MNVVIRAGCKAMIGIDTHILVRYIAQDDAAQSARATRLIESECSASMPGFDGSA